MNDIDAEKYKDNERKVKDITYNPIAVKPEVFKIIRPFFPLNP
jgi:hypothetical protein